MQDFYSVKLQNGFYGIIKKFTGTFTGTKIFIFIGRRSSLQIFFQKKFCAKKIPSQTRYDSGGNNI